MALVDYVFAGIVLISVLFGALRGFIREVLGLATWVCAFAAALGYGPECIEPLKRSISSEPIRFAVGYALPFFLVLLTGGLLTWLIARLVRGAGLAPVDRMLGAGFGLLRGGLILVALVILAGNSALERESWWRQSFLVPRIKPFARQVETLIPAEWLAYMRAQQSAPPATVPQRVQ